MKELTGEELEEKVKFFWKLVDRFPTTRAQAVKKMMGGKLGENYFISPASHREDYHECYAGGLLVHSLNVAAELRKLAKALCPGRYPTEVLDFLALFHDLGKAGDGKEPYYLPTDWKRGKEIGHLYKMNERLLWMSVTDRSLWLMQSSAVELSEEEFLAIRLADGMFSEDNRSYGLRQPHLAVLLHTADLWATLCEKETFRSESP